MRWISVMLVGAAALVTAQLEGCGGKVVIDAENIGGSGGTGGAGGSGGTGGTGGSMSSSSGNTCMPGVCSGTPDGACDCSATCAGQDARTTCFSTSGSYTCTCELGGETKAKCEGAAGTFACDVQQGCCAQYFP